MPTHHFSITLLALDRVTSDGFGTQSDTTIKDIAHFRPPSEYSDILLLINVKWGKSSKKLAASSIRLETDDAGMSKVVQPSKHVAKSSQRSDERDGPAKISVGPDVAVAPQFDSGEMRKPTGARLDAAEEPPQPPPASGAEKRAHHRRKGMHPRSFHWGPHRMTFIPPHSWQACCGRRNAHKNCLNTKTLCTRTLSFRGEDTWGFIRIQYIGCSFRASTPDPSKRSGPPVPRAAGHHLCSGV